MGAQNKESDKLSVQIDTTETPDGGSPIKYKVLKDQVVQLTAQKAEELLNLRTFRGERDVVDGHVQYLYDQWKQGRFIWDHVLLATAKIKGEEEPFRINGQHTCWARMFMPPSTTARIRHIEYEVPDEDNLRALYAVFDRNKSRTPGHIIKALLAGKGDVEGVWDSLINVLASGLRFWKFENRDEFRRNGPTELATLIQVEYTSLFQNVGLFYQRNFDTHRHIRRQPVVAAMFATFEKMPTEAPKFWQPVADGLGLEQPTDPRYKLREFLTQVKVDVAASGHGRSASTEEVYRICILAWNKWRRGEKVQAAYRSTDRRYKPV